VGWATDPLHVPRSRALDLADTDAGNRYDPILADFDVLSLPEEDNARYLDITHHRSIAWLNSELKALVATLGLKRLTVSEITTGDRKLTRCISSWLHSQQGRDGQPIFDGVRYPSCHGDDFECWAVFADRVTMRITETRTIEPSDPDLQHVAKLFGLTIF